MNVTDLVIDLVDELRSARANHNYAMSELHEATEKADRMSDELEAMRADVEQLTAERDEARQEAVRLRAERDASCLQAAKLLGQSEELAALKASNPAVNMSKLERLAIDVYCNAPYDAEHSIRAVVRAVIAHLGLAPTSEQTGEVSP